MSRPWIDTVQQAEGRERAAAPRADAADGGGVPPAGSSGGCSADGTLTITFEQRKPGLELGNDATGITVLGVRQGSAAEAAGVLPKFKLLSINGSESPGGGAAEAAAHVARSPRPISLGFAAPEHAGRPPWDEAPTPAADRGVPHAKAVDLLQYAARSQFVLSISARFTYMTAGTFLIGTPTCACTTRPRGSPSKG
jgi:hypothetical protein